MKHFTKVQAKLKATRDALKAKEKANRRAKQERICYSVALSREAKLEAEFLRNNPKPPANAPKKERIDYQIKQGMYIQQELKNKSRWQATKHSKKSKPKTVKS